MISNTHNIEEMNREKTRTARLSIVSNLTLVLLKLVVGLMIGSVSVISEAIHSSIDLVAAIIAYFSVKTSSQPADKQHAFGHGKIENISGTIEAVLIFFAAGLIIYEAIQKLIEGVVLEDVSLGIAVMLFAAVVNFFVSRALMKTAKRTESIALEADALHLKTDVVTSLGIFVGLVAIKLTGIAVLDPILAILVALFILKEALQMTLKSARDLLDAGLPEEEESEITQIIARHSTDYVGFHELRTRKSGSDRFIDLHLVVSKKITVEESHNIADGIEKGIIGRFPRASVMIHVEPCTGEEACVTCKGACKDGI
jgi:cation diffusion facilitator family transporter